MKKTFLASILTISLLIPSLALGQAAAVQITAQERAIAENIKAEQLSTWLHYVASDEMGGRDTPSAGLDMTADFLKKNLEKWGFKGAGDNGTFYQKIALTRESPDPENLKLEIAGRQFKAGEDFGRQAGHGAVKGGLVFGGNGWLVKSKDMDAFKGIDVAGKIVVVYSEARAASLPPPGVTQADLSGERGKDWADPMTYAAVKGAAGLLIIASPQVQATFGRFVANTRTSLFPEKLRQAGSGPAIPAIPTLLVSQAVGDAIFAGEAGTRTSPNGFAINKTASFNAALKKETLWTQNVVALWEGGDPKLKAEMVAVGAHYDHDGTRPTAQGEDKIWNGADDDGSGTVAVLAIAEALAKSKVRPKRSVLLVWHAGEEKGLWGANYFNKFPTVDIKNVVAQLNIDMIGRSKKPGDTNPKNKDLTDANSVYVIGSEMMSSTLGAVTKGTNDGFLKLGYDYKYDDPNDTNRFFFRSDHFHYAQNGIPIVFWFSGVHEDYHQPSDTADKIDYQKMEKIARTIFLTMWEVADLNERPAVDKKLPPELTRR
jgi:Zn-dependent M28 family amino/carboxypeptidase